MQVVLREEVLPVDASTVREIVASTGFFHDHEIDVAVELVDERLSKGPPSGYLFIFAECEGRVAGYACYGPIACTTHSYDVYWIAVHADFQGRGLGRTLLTESEHRIARAGGRRVYVETSGRDQYQPTRSFYEHCGYRREALLTEFYGPGDDKVVYLKTL